MPSVTERKPNRNGTYYSDDEVADLLGISLGRLRNKLCAGNPLPPRIEPPGCRHRLWPCQAFHDWLEQYTVSADTAPNREHRCRLQTGIFRSSGVVPEDRIRDRGPETLRLAGGQKHLPD